MKNLDSIRPKKVTIAQIPTPIISINRFFSKDFDKQIWLKRDDLTGIELSGNKVRKLEYLFADAKNKGAEHVISCGGIQSNHCRAVAFMAAKLDYKCTLFLRGEKQNKPTGNYLLDILTGANIRFVNNDEYKNIDLIMSDYAAEIEKKNETVYVIPEGGSNEIGIWGYIDCYLEIIEQIQEMDISIDAIAVATGSGGTHAGLMAGLLLTGSTIPVLSVNVCDSAEYFKTKICNILTKFSGKWKIDLNIDRDRINIIDGYVDIPNSKGANSVHSFISKFTRMEGIVLDSTYTAKALIGLNDQIKRGKVSYSNILFIHTGGIFSIFN